MTAEPIAARPKNVALAMSRLATLRSRRLWLVLLFVGFALQVAWRLHLSLPLTGPIAQPDEDGYLLGARVLAGGPEATLPAASIMRPMGYPLLLAPVYLFVQEPVKVYLGVHIVNAVLMAANFPLLYVLGRRLFNTSRVWTAVAAFVLALLPRLVYFGDFALTDVLLPGLLMVLLLAVHEMLTGNRRLVAGVVAGVAAGYAANTRVRGLVMLVALGGSWLLPCGGVGSPGPSPPRPHRVNNHIYGRYVALFAGLWSLVAIVSLVRATWRRSVANRRVDWAGTKYGYEIDLVCHEGKNLTWAVWEREPGTPNAA